ncbi:MAG TPA: HAD family phosphatase [Thermoleophilaceae bacterium]|nr:HAD family phosphatase [Thermoleophilaceae bacterium]
MSTAVAAVAFDLDGVIVDTEPFWADAKREVVLEAGGKWKDDAPTAMLGMSGPEWAHYLRDELGVPLSGSEIRERVVGLMLARLRGGVPLLPGAGDAVKRVAERWPLALASSADRPVIEAVLEAAGLAGFFQVVVASDEVGRGKPAPDVYLAAAQRLGADARHVVGIEDSPNGMRAVKAAGMALVAIPNPSTDVGDDVLRTADVVLGSVSELTTDVVERAARPLRADRRSARDETGLR